MQFGHALQRILQRMYDADPRHGTIYMMRVDIADGFYRVGLAPEDVPSLGVCLHLGPDGKTMVAFPLVLPMGWVKSPPQFCSVTDRTWSRQPYHRIPIHQPKSSGRVQSCPGLH